MPTVGNSVIDAINQVASNARVRLAMLMGAKLESGWNPNAVGDNGTSFGIFQIHLPAHPSVTAAQAKDPYFAARYMLKSYENGVGRVDNALWDSNPAQAAALAAFYAERPKNMYPANRITGAWPDVNKAWTGGTVNGGTTDEPVDSLTNTKIPSPGDMWNEIWKSISWFLYDNGGGLINKIYFALLVGGGGITVAVGLYLLFKDSRAQAVTSNVVGAYAALGRAGISTVRRSNA